MNYTITPTNFTTTYHPVSSKSYLEYDNVTIREITVFNRVFALALNVSDKTDNILSVIGALGNFVALLTLFRSRSMSTPSFVYHKILIAADLMFCLNHLFLKLLNHTMSTWVPPATYLYHNKLTVFYVGTAYRVLTSSFGYLVLYMSTAVGVDRFVALILARFYDKFNRKRVAWTIVVVCTVLSVLVHSWSTWFERRTVEIPKQVNFTDMVYYTYVDDKQNSNLRAWIKVKDIYNMVVRIIYPILLTILTGSVIYAYNSQQKRRRTLCTVNKRRLRRERCLFLLMVAVVILTYVQVIPRETKRILDLLYPVPYLTKQMKNQHLPWTDRLKCFYILSYGHQFLKLIQNTCTAIDRSLLFYLYFILNYSFRREVIKLFHLEKYCFKTMIFAGKYGRRSRNTRRNNNNNYYPNSSSRPGASPLLRNTGYNFTDVEFSGVTSAVF